MIHGPKNKGNLNTLFNFINNLYSKEKKNISINQEDEIISKTLINKEL